MLRITLTLILLFVYTDFIFAADIVSDGGTATTIINNADGSTQVDIAPDSGNSTSYNSYTNFNVPKPGVYLNNTVQKVNTIINEVTSLNPSLLEGKLSVLGPKAYVVIANPNGITVNGGTFVNTAGLALAAGKITGMPPGNINIFIRTDDNGFVNIGEYGLSGEFNELVLIAKKIKVEGDVENTKSTSNGLIRVIAGDNEVEFDTSVDIVGARPWVANYTAQGDDSTGIYLVDITSLGSLHSSKMYIVVTDQGAGVKVNGQLGANAAEMTLEMNGNLLCQGADIDAKTDLTINAGSFNSEMNGDTKTTITADQGTLSITTTSGDITNKGGELTSGLTDDTRDVLDADMLILNSSGKIINESVDENNLGIIFSQYGNLNIEAVDDILNNNGRILANGKVKIKSTAGDFESKVFKDILSNEGVQEWYSKVKRFLFFKRTRRGFNIAYGDLQIDTHLGEIIGGTGVSIEANNVINYGSNINAWTNNVEIKANEMTNEAVLTGRAYFERKKGFFTEQSGSGDVTIHGGQITAENKVQIELIGDLYNKGGDIAAGNDIDITADEVITESLATYAYVALDRGLSGSWGQLLRSDRGGSLSANMGYLKIHTRTPVISRGGLFAYATTTDIPQGIDEERQAVEETLNSGDIGMLF